MSPAMFADAAAGADAAPARLQAAAFETAASRAEGAIKVVVRP
jgi:hypothetical protein